ncbi:hypothetical protein EGW08_004696 [Elysia chlorotica]|uniref:NR LBD domain-containing protein n=1 Tax=Elysia chlorotica TaxID=188477 RepID=A0A3S1A0E8_ELYCH|nr:hypothetical protein EGW08_004696 [Elysia chlorotica]
MIREASPSPEKRFSYLDIPSPSSLEPAYSSLYPHLLRHATRSGLSSLSALPGLHAGLHGLSPLHSLHSSFVQPQAFLPRLVCNHTSLSSQQTNMADKHQTLTSLFPALSQPVVCGPAYLETNFRCSGQNGAIFSNTIINDSNNSDSQYSCSGGNESSVHQYLGNNSGRQYLGNSVYSNSERKSGTTSRFDNSSSGNQKTADKEKSCSSGSADSSVKDHSIDTLLYASTSQTNAANNNNNSICNSSNNNCSSSSNTNNKRMIYSNSSSSINNANSSDTITKRSGGVNNIDINTTNNCNNNNNNNKNNNTTNSNNNNYSIRNIVGPERDDARSEQTTGDHHQEKHEMDDAREKTPSPDSSRPWCTPQPGDGQDMDHDASPKPDVAVTTNSACADSQTSPTDMRTKRVHTPGLLAPTPIRPLQVAPPISSLSSLTGLSLGCGSGLPLSCHTILSPATAQAPMHQLPVPPNMSLRIPAMLAGHCFQLGQLPVTSTPGKPTLTSHHVTSFAEEIMAACVTWARLLPAFSTLPDSDRRRLLEATWTELFLLVAAEKGLTFEPNLLLSTMERSLIESGHQEAGASHPLMTPRQMAGTYSHLQDMRELLLAFQAIKIDPTEGSCLRSIVLFRFYTRGLQAGAEIQRLQEKDHLAPMCIMYSILEVYKQALKYRDFRKRTIWRPCVSCILYPVFCILYHVFCILCILHPTDTRGLQASAEIQRLQEKAHLALMSHCSRTYPSDLLRTNRFLMLLPRLREIPPRVIKDVFFRHSAQPEANIERLFFEFAGSPI